MTSEPFVRLELRNLRRGDVAKPLRAERGGVADGDSVRGEGWVVRFVDGESAQVGRLRVPVLFVEVEGPMAAEIARFLRLQTMRGGG